MRVGLWIENKEYYSIEEYALALINYSAEEKYIIVHAYPCEDDRVNHRNAQAGFVFERSNGYDELCSFIKNFIDTGI